MENVKIKKEIVSMYDIEYILNKEFYALWLNYNQNYIYDLFSQSQLNIHSFISNIYNKFLLDIFDYLLNNYWLQESILEISEDDYNYLIIQEYKKNNIEIVIMLIMIKTVSFVEWKLENNIITITDANISKNIKYFFILDQYKNMYFSDNQNIFIKDYWEAPFFMVKLNKIEFIY